MSWIRKTSTGRYRACHRDPSGNTVSKTWDKESDAKRWLAKQTVTITEGIYTSPRLGRMPFGAYWTRFLESAEIRPSTRDRYERHYRLYLKGTFEHRPLSGIGPLDVKTWKADLERKGTGSPTVAACLRLAKTVFNRAVDDEIIGRNPARAIPVASSDPEGGLRVLEAGQVAKLAEAHPDRFKALAYVLAYRGPRIGEAAALKVGDFDPMRARLTIHETATEVAGHLDFGPPKTKAGHRTLTLPPFLRDMLAEHLGAFSDPKDPTRFIFTMPEGGPLRANNYRKRVFYPAVRDAGLDPELSPHDLRDTAATLAFAAGATVKEVSTMLGHANPAITLKRYTGVLESMSARTDEALEATFRAAADKGQEQVGEVLGFPG